VIGLGSFADLLAHATNDFELAPRAAFMSSHRQYISLARVLVAAVAHGARRVVEADSLDVRASA
jgi:hypothetical protein